MPKNFTVVVTDANGKQVVKGARASVAGMTPEQLAEHYVRHNVFPGAKAIEIHESSETLPQNLKDAIRAVGTRGMRRAPTAPLTTPLATWVKPEGTAGDDLANQTPGAQEATNALESAPPGTPAAPVIATPGVSGAGSPAVAPQPVRTPVGQPVARGGAVAQPGSPARPPQG